MQETRGSTTSTRPEMLPFLLTLTRKTAPNRRCSYGRARFQREPEFLARIAA